MEPITLKMPPPAVGEIEIFENIFWQVTRKPIWIHRIMLRLFFGWKWKDLKQASCTKLTGDKRERE